MLVPWLKHPLRTRAVASGFAACSFVFAVARAPGQAGPAASAVAIATAGQSRAVIVVPPEALHPVRFAAARADSIAIRET